MATRRRAVMDVVRELLERGYTQQMTAVLRAIAANSERGILAQRLREFNDEAARLAAAGQRLSPNNPVFRALMADFEDAMRANRTLLASVADDVQATGINVSQRVARQLALPGFDARFLEAIGVVWNQPDPEALAALIRYTQSAEWAARLARYGDGVPEIIQNVAARAFVNGWGALRAARELTRAVTYLPRHYANTMMRTLMMTAYRDADVVQRVANANILEYQIRIAALDDRTCMACVVLHGEQLPINARIDDHHNGRCTSITVVKGRPVPAVTAGMTWFERRTPSQQQAQMGKAAYDAWQSGAIQPRDLVRKYDDRVFGGMVAEASLKGILGPAAQDYYAVQGQ